MTTTATAPAKTTPNWVRIERPDMDKMIKFGSDDFIKNTIPSLTKEQLTKALAYAKEKDAVKQQPGNFLVFPVSKPKQVAAGKLYLGSLKRFMQAVQAEIDKRAVNVEFDL